jgi:hypothetical protein
MLIPKLLKKSGKRQTKKHLKKCRKMVILHFFIWPITFINIQLGFSEYIQYFLDLFKNNKNKNKGGWVAKLGEWVAK